MQHYLLVANRTLGGPELADVISDRLSRGPATFWVLAPATPGALLINDFNALSCAFPVAPDLLPSATDEAHSRLDTELGRLRTLGAQAEGSVGDADPLRAIEDILASHAIDEIILSTLPPGISRWLAWDLPHRLRRRTTVPLTVVASSVDA